MKMRAILLGLLAAAVLAGTWFLWGPSSTPVGQQPLVILNSANFSEFEKAFDAKSDSPRIVLLLSPT
jgi:hypothetical protein